MAVSCEVAGAVVSLSASSLTGIWDPRVASAIGPVLSLLATRQCVWGGGVGGCRLGLCISFLHPLPLSFFLFVKEMQG